MRIILHRAADGHASHIVVSQTISINDEQYKALEAWLVESHVPASLFIGGVGFEIKELPKGILPDDVPLGV